MIRDNLSVRKFRNICKVLYGYFRNDFTRDEDMRLNFLSRCFQNVKEVVTNAESILKAAKEIVPSITLMRYFPISSRKLNDI